MSSPDQKPWTPEAREHALQEAQALIRLVAGSLDRSSKPCRCCDAKRYNNFTEAKAAEELEAKANQLDDLRRRLATPRGKR